MNKIFTYLVLVSIIILVLSLNAFPNYWGHINTKPGNYFTGQASWFDPWDINLYVAAIKSGQSNGFFLNNVYTTTPNQAILFYPLYTTSGLLFPKINSYLIFHILAAFFGSLLIITIWKAIKIFLKTITEKLIALFIISIGGGIGWLFFPNLKSADLFITSFTYMSSFQRAHEALGIILYLISLTGFYIAVNQKKYIFSIFSAISMSALVFIYPYYLLAYLAITFIYSLYVVKKDNYKTSLYHFVLILLINTPILLFYNSILQSNPTLSGVLSQKLHTPNILEILAGWGILAPLLILQLINPNKNSSWVFLNIWVWISLLLAYLPFGFSRFYLRGLFFPITILCLLNLTNISNLLRVSKKIILLIIITLLPISSFLITYKRVVESNNSNPWYYLNQSQKSSFKFLNNLPPKKNILSLYITGNIIPSNTNHNVYVGHLIQTPNANDKLLKAGLFFANKLSSDEAKLLLASENIDYIYYGPEEKNMTKTYSKEEGINYNNIKPVFIDDEITIYENVFNK